MAMNYRLLHHATPTRPALLRAWCLALLLLLYGLHAAPVARAISGPINSPGGLALRLSDLPAGFYIVGGGFLTVAGTAKLDHVNAGALAKEGMLKSFETTFERGGRTGMIYVWDTATSFRSSGGTHSYYGQILSYARKTRVLRQHLHPFPVGYLGDEHTGWIYSYTYGEISVTATYTVFRRGNYVARLLVFGGLDNFFPGQGLELARLVDARMSTAH
jgi:hypothetical protein